MLTLTPDRHYFLLDGKPFFWLGDTAWLLFQKLTPDEADIYLRNRAEKGFNVVQATLVHTKDFRNRAGSPALLDDDFARPNPDPAPEAYWPMVRAVVDAAAARGIIMALLPSWGHFVSSGRLAGAAIDPYIDFLAERFGDCENVIWLVGGDVRGSDAPEDFDHIGRRLREKCPRQLIGFHPFGRCSSSQWFQDAPWLDFHLFQSGHRRYDQVRLNQWDDKVDTETFVGEDNYRYVTHDRALLPPRPVLDGEPSYEFILQGLHDPSQPYWQTRDVRRYAYWSLMAGAAGFTYGSNAIMQFWQGTEPGAFGVFETWQEALHNPGSMQMSHVRRLMEEMDWQSGEPAQDCLVRNTGTQYDCNLALKTDKGLCVYSYTGKPFEVDTRRLGESDAWWFDPVSGGRSYMGCVPAAEAVRFAPPDRRCDQNDWVLILARTAGR